MGVEGYILNSCALLYLNIKKKLVLYFFMNLFSVCVLVPRFYATFVSMSIIIAIL